MSATREAPVRCRALRTNGQPCTAPAVRGGLCIGHQPGAAAAHVKGGKATSSANRALKLLPSRLQPIVDTLEKVFYEVYEGNRSLKSATAMATVALAIGKLVLAGELEMRVRAIEAQMRQETGRPDRWPA